LAAGAGGAIIAFAAVFAAGAAAIVARANDSVVATIIVAATFATRCGDGFCFRFAAVGAFACFFAIRFTFSGSGYFPFTPIMCKRGDGFCLYFAAVGTIAGFLAIRFTFSGSGYFPLAPIMCKRGDGSCLYFAAVGTIAGFLAIRFTFSGSGYFPLAPTVTQRIGYAWNWSKPAAVIVPAVPFHVAGFCAGRGVSYGVIVRPDRGFIKVDDKIASVVYTACSYKPIISACSVSAGGLYVMAGGREDLVCHNPVADGANFCF